MIKKFVQMVKDYPALAMLPPTGLGIFTFIGHLMIAVSDGNIDTSEVHDLLQSASGIETVLLIVIVLILRRK